MMGGMMSMGMHPMMVQQMGMMAHAMAHGMPHGMPGGFPGGRGGGGGGRGGGDGGRGGDKDPRGLKAYVDLDAAGPSAAPEIDYRNPSY